MWAAIDDDPASWAVCLCWVVVLGLTLVGALARPAYAHAFLVRTNPPQGTRLDGPPRELSLEFSEPGPLLHFEVSGDEFVDTEPYASGTADDVYPLTGDEAGFRFYIAGDRIWIRVWLDDLGRLARERIVNVGHVIERTFTYPDD